MKNKEWLISERRRIKKGMNKTEREEKNTINILPFVLESEDYHRAKYLGKKILNLRSERKGAVQRIKLLSKILGDNN